MKSTYDKIWKSSLNALQRRQMSRSDLMRKLKMKYPDEEGDIIKILDEMERVELLNDKRYTEQLINHLIQRPIGRFKIIIETKKRGLDQDLVQSMLISSDYDEEKMCKKAFEEKNKFLKESDPRKRKQKMMNFLRNRGFANNVIYMILNNS